MISSSMKKKKRQLQRQYIEGKFVSLIVLRRIIHPSYICTLQHGLKSQCLLSVTWRAPVIFRYRPHLNIILQRFWMKHSHNENIRQLY
jgi:hypothetical protein